DPKVARATSTPEWLRQQGMRVLWTPLFATRDGRRAVRSGASLDSLVALLDAGGFNLLAGDAGPESSDSLHTYWEERLAVRRAWADAVKRLQPPSLARIPLLDSGKAGEVAARATVLRDRVLKQRRDLYFAFRLAQPPADWFTLGLLRGFGLPDRPLLLFTPEVWTRDLLALYRARGLNMVHAIALVPPLR